MKRPLTTSVIRIVQALPLLILSAVIAACSVIGSQKTADNEEKQRSKAAHSHQSESLTELDTLGNYKYAEFYVDSLVCPLCAKHLHAHLREQEGILFNKVSYEEKTASVKYDCRKINIKGIIKAIEEEDYGAEVKSEGH